MTRFTSSLYTTLFMLFIINAAHEKVFAADYSKKALKADPCLVIEEEIIPLLPPNLEQSAMWKKTVGVKGEDRPRALLSVMDGGQIAIGESRIYDEKKGFAERQIEIVRTDKTGKLVVNKWVVLKNLQSVADAVLLKDRIVVLAQIGTTPTKTELVLQFLNGIGEPTAAVTLYDAGRHLIPKSLVVAQGGDKMVVAATSISDTNAKDFNTVLFWVDKNGRQVLKRAYLPGVQNKPEYVGRLQNGNLAVTGRITDNDGRESGWVMKLAANGDIMFQRPYARGADSVVRSAISYGRSDMIAVGDTIPNTGDKAAWVMKLDGNGNILWQKYLTGKYVYTGIDSLVAPDGRMNILVAGKPSIHGGREHARVITLSNAGQVIGDEAYLEGSNSIPFRFVAQNGLRYLLGTSQTSVSKATLEEGAEYVTYDMWLLGLPALPIYQNPCGKGPDRTLDDLP